MKRNTSKIISAAVCVGMLFCSTATAFAETVDMEAQYPMHGNDCGEIIISPEIDRDICVTIEQITEDGDFKFYENVIIPAGGELTGENDYRFVIEGKGAEPTKYTLTIGVPKYKGSTNYQLFVQEIEITDTDFIVDEVIEGYTYTYTLGRDDELEEPTVIASTEPAKDENNVISSSMTINFPASDTLPGDVNFSGTVDLYDVIGIAKYLMDKSYLTADQIAAGDFNGNGVTDLYDAIDIAKELF